MDQGEEQGFSPVVNGGLFFHHMEFDLNFDLIKLIW